VRNISAWRYIETIARAPSADGKSGLTMVPSGA
jgi:hypothetical protein